MIDLSVVIPTYNRLDTLRVVIPALLRSDVRPDRFEVIVADSNSNDGTAEFLREVDVESAAAPDKPQLIAAAAEPGARH